MIENSKQNLFSTIVAEPHQIKAANWKIKLGLFAEKYFDFGQKRYKIQKIDPQSRSLHLEKDTSNKKLFSTTLKIISYITIIFPILMFIAKAYLHLSYRLVEHIPLTEQSSKKGEISHSSESDGSSPISSEEDKKTRTHHRYVSELNHELRLLALMNRDTTKLLKTCTTVKSLLRKLKKSNLRGRDTLKRNGKLVTTIDNIPVILINFPRKNKSPKTYALLGNPETSFLGEGFSKKVYVGFDIKKKQRVVLSFLKYQDETEIDNGKQEARITEYLKSNNVPLVGKILHFNVIKEGNKKRLCVVQKPYFGGTLENKLDTLTSAQKYRIAYHLL